MKRLAILAILVLTLAIPVSVSAITYDSTLILENKDPSTWAILTDNRSGTLQYNASSSVFVFAFNAVGMESGVPYSLIYYADPYPGCHPGALIGTGTADSGGNVAISGSVNIGSMPKPPDPNMLMSHSNPPDNYAHAYGAKIWLVPTACYSAGSKSILSWQPTRFLFETDLINYTDTDEYQGQWVQLMSNITVPTPTIGLNVSPPSIGYGTVSVGVCSAEYPITLTNTGNTPIKVTATTSAGFYTDCLKINNLTANGWVSGTIPATGNLVIQTKVCPTSGYTGSVNGTISFVASFSQ